MDVSQRISSMEKKMPFFLTKGRLEESSFNFKEDQKIKNSDVVTFNSIPSSLRVEEEDRNADFSLFGHDWNNIQEINVVSISTSQDGKFSIAAKNMTGLYLSLDFGNSWIDVNDDLVSSIMYNSVCISLDGSILIATSSVRSVISKDFGNSWNILNIISSNNNSPFISCDNKEIIVSNLEGVNISKDFGLTWENISENFNYFASSSNTQYISLFKQGEESKIHYLNGTINESDSPVKIWNSLSVSSTGQYQTAISNDNLIWISSNYGVNWKASDSTINETINNVSMSGSGKFQLISGPSVFVSSDFGRTWRPYFTNGENTIKYVCLSYNGRMGIMYSNYSIFTSLITTEYIKQKGTLSFSPLNRSSFASSFVVEQDKIDGSNSLYTQLLNDKSKIVSSRYGKYKTITINGGNIWRTDDYGVTYTNTNFGNCSSIAISSCGKYQTGTVITGELWRSDDYGLNFFSISSSFLGIFNINDIAMSGNGKYQTVCGDGGNIAYSSDFGYNWTYSTICSNNLVSITMSKDGKYQSVCGSNDGDSNSVMYSKTFGINWKYSNLQSSGVQWKSISCSSCGQYQTICSSNLNNNSSEIDQNIIISEDFGVNWTESLSGSRNWVSVYVTYDGQRQLLCEYGGDIYLSLDFGYTWNSCYSNVNNWRNICVSDTLQFIDVLTEDSLLTSKIDNEGNIPGVIKVNVKSIINDNSTILLSGNSSNIYSYKINNTKSFEIYSSDIEDRGNVSYSVLSYGQSFC